MTAVQKSRIGYLPLSPLLDSACDRRRFLRYAAMRDLSVEVVSKWDDHEIIVLSPSADVNHWLDAPSDRILVMDMVDAYLDERIGLRRSLRGLGKWVVGDARRPVFSHLRVLKRLLTRVDAVVCSSEEQAATIAPFNRNVHPVLDFHSELEVGPPIINETPGLNIVWEGQIATLPAIHQVLPALKRLARTIDVRLHLVTSLAAPRYMNRFVIQRTEELVRDWAVETVLHPWGVETLYNVARFCDLAIVPVEMTNPMAVRKPENRMRIFWRLGLPVIASATQAHERALLTAGSRGAVLCSTESDWERSLTVFANRPEVRLEHAKAGQAAALSTYSEESLARRWDDVLRSLPERMA